MNTSPIPFTRKQTLFLLMERDLAHRLPPDALVALRTVAEVIRDHMDRVNADVLAVGELVDIFQRAADSVIFHGSSAQPVCKCFNSNELQGQARARMSPPTSFDKTCPTDPTNDITEATTNA